MITQIIIKEDRDLGISNNWGQPEPFQSAVKAQMFSHVPFEPIDDLTNRHIINRKLRNYIRNKWQNVPYMKIGTSEPVNNCLFTIFNKSKINF